MGKKNKPVVIDLCPKHRRYLDWADCVEGWEDRCSIALARAMKEAGQAKRAKTVYIPDDIQALNVSRQRKLQLAFKRLGLCQSCGGPLYGKTFCLYHHIMSRERQRQAKGSVRRYMNADSYKTEREIRETI